MKKPIFIIVMWVVFLTNTFATEIDQLILQLNNKQISLGEKADLKNKIIEMANTNKNNLDFLVKVYIDSNNDDICYHISTLMNSKKNLITLTNKVIEKINLPSIGNNSYPLKKNLESLMYKIQPDDNAMKQIILSCNDKFIQEKAYNYITEKNMKRILLINKEVSNYVKEKHILDFLDTYGTTIGDTVLSLNNKEGFFDKSNIIKALEMYDGTDEIYFKILKTDMDIEFKKVILKKLKDQLSLYYLFKDGTDTALKQSIFDQISDKKYLKLITEQDVSNYYKEKAFKKLENDYLTYEHYKQLIRLNDEPFSFSLIQNVMTDKNHLKDIMEKDKIQKNRGIAAIKLYDINKNNIAEKVKNIENDQLLKDIQSAVLNLYGEKSNSVDAINKELKSRGKLGKIIMLISFVIILLMILIQKIGNSSKTNICTDCDNEFNNTHSWCPVCGEINGKIYFLNVKLFKIAMIPASAFILGFGIYAWKFQNTLLLLLSIGAFILSGLLFFSFFPVYIDDSAEKKEIEKLKKNRNLLAHSNDEKRIEAINEIQSIDKLNTLLDKENSLKVKNQINEKIKKLKMPSLIEKAINAAMNNNFETLKTCVEEGVDVNTRNNNGASLLFTACYKKNLKMVNYLLEKGANCNSKINLGATPLFVAVQGNDHVEIVKELLKKGADTNIQNHEGNTPLILTASENGNLEIAKLLIENGADVNLANNMNITALYFAAQNNYIDFAKILLNHKVNPNISMHEGATPLFVASQLGYTNMVKLLLENGADKNIAFKEEILPVEIASENDHHEIVELLANGNINIDKYAFEERKAKKYLKDLGQLCKEEGIYSIWSWIDSRTNEKRYKFLNNISESNDFEFESPEYITDKTMLYENGTMRVAGRELADGPNWNES